MVVKAKRVGKPILRKVKRLATKDSIKDFGAGGNVLDLMTIELATSLIFLVSNIYGPATNLNVVTDNKLEPEIKKEISIQNPISLEDHVKEYFKEAPVLAEIAKCESTYRHFKKDGTIVRGKINPADVGLMQINEKYHVEQAKKLGFDIYTLEGNMAYAKWLYEKEGVKPWKSSSKCWDDELDKVAYIPSEKIGN